MQEKQKKIQELEAQASALEAQAAAMEEALPAECPAAGCEMCSMDKACARFRAMLGQAYRLRQQAANLRRKG